MTPYYDQDGITIYHGDCRDVLPGLTAGVVVTDPPYNVGIEYGKGTNDTNDRYEDWCREWFEALPADVPTAVATGIVNVGMWYRISPPRWIIAWHKPATMGRSPLGFNNWEPVLFWGKPHGSASTDVVTAPILPDSGLNGHPCPKPLKWASGLVARLATTGDVVLDPFAGAGTTLRAARDQGLSAIGIEIEERYCEIAVQRLAQGVLDFA